jgi:large conductance mechanosensitive channel
MGFLQEFKEFAMKGNVLDMAVGIIIGAEFGKIVNSLVTDVIMPPIGLAIGGVDFKNIRIPLKTTEAGEVLVAMNIGNFINTAITFTIIAFSVFLLVKAFNTLKRPAPKT